MKVFKFGGASVKDTAAIKNMCAIVKEHEGDQLVVVVSAMGKTTNALEQLLDLSWFGENYDQKLEQLQSYHFGIIDELFGDGGETTREGVSDIFSNLKKQLSSKYEDYNQLYDAIVCHGEYLSTKIISDYLSHLGHPTLLLDAAKVIRTDATFKEGKVEWQETEAQIATNVGQNTENATVVSQGFIGGTANNQVTTLGREGSDFTAAIFASCLRANAVTIWKDVPGILTADPKLIPEARLFSELPYNEASEMTYYGASVIHPKTIKPLAIKNIPLFVRSFDNPDAPGTCIHDCNLENPPTAIIFKKDQCLFSFKVVDFTFVNEDAISKIFGILHDVNIKINIMQNSAISFSVCFDYNKIKVDNLIDRLGQEFRYFYNLGLTLITLKNYTEEEFLKYSSREDILLEQKSRKNYRVLVSSPNPHGDS